MKTILLISPYWKEPHRWMVSSYKLTDLWQRLGYRVVVACMGPAGKEVVSPTLTIYRKKDIFLKDPWNYGIAFGFGGFVKKIVKEEKPDVIVCNKILFWTSISVLWLRLSGRKTILLTDALVGITWWPRGWLPRLAARLYAWTLGWWIMRAAEKIVFFHPQPEKVLKRLGVLGKSIVIPTGIDPSPYDGSPKTIKEDHTEASMVYVGRMESVKGVGDFLAAAVRVKERYTKATVKAVGWYKEEHPLVKKYETAAEFTGLRSDIPEVLKSADIFVLPSYSEGLSNALMEAMSSGCACVATDVGGNAYLIQNGVSGFLYPAGDREALAGHLRRLVEDPAKRLAIGAAARKRIDEQFSWKVVGERYKKLFEGEL
jgi:glycosyltransferase involved in cell wall biosynthesis